MSLDWEKSKDGRQPGRACDLCLSMTSTVEGLRDLVSEEGYKHSREVEIIKSAARGCPCCDILRRCISAWADNGAITISAADPAIPMSTSPSTRRYPLEATTLKLYINKKPSANPITVFTTPGGSSINTFFNGFTLMTRQTTQLQSS